MAQFISPSFVVSKFTQISKMNFKYEQLGKVQYVSEINGRMIDYQGFDIILATISWDHMFSEH